MRYICKLGLFIKVPSPLFLPWYVFLRALNLNPYIERFAGKFSQKKWVTFNLFGVDMKLFVFCVAYLFFTGCAAGKVYIYKSADDQASCYAIDKELQKGQRKIETLENTDHTLQYVRDTFLSIIQLSFPPMGILNAILTVSDSHVADLAETKALEDRHNGMVAISNQKECGYKYAMITSNEVGR